MAMTNAQLQQILQEQRARDADVLVRLAQLEVSLFEKVEDMLSKQSQLSLLQQGCNAALATAPSPLPAQKPPPSLLGALGLAPAPDAPAATEKPPPPDALSPPSSASPQGGDSEPPLPLPFPGPSVGQCADSQDPKDGKAEAAAARRDQSPDRRAARFVETFQGQEIYGAESIALTTAQANALLRKQQALLRQQRRERMCVLMPESNIRFTWDMVATVLIFFIAIALPFRIAFVEAWHLGWAVADFLIDMFFIVDVIVNFRTAYVDTKTGQLVTSSKRMALHYMRRWFIIDLLASFPIDWTISGVNFTEPPPTELAASASDITRVQSAQLPSMLRLFKLVKLLRLLRVARLLVRRCSLESPAPTAAALPC